ncbi:MAG: SulP family inorganic anion transporter [Pirellulales bacterium]|nr:SulP family inorganic anion transporter [Pirellulales bacterium]
MSAESDLPRGDLAGFVKYFKYDIVSGFLVFLIALPLCLSISLSYGYPAIAGVFTAVIGGILTAFVSNSEMTIKGPAAGLIVIAAGCVADFSGKAVIPGEVNMEAYRAALAVGVAAGVIQILFGLFRVGVLGDFFPSSVVHGMLAAIGVIIIAKQIPPTLGVKVGGEPIPLLVGIPKIVAHLEPSIAIVGVVSMLIMFIWPLIAKRVAALKPVPAAIVVLLVSIPLAQALKLDHTHSHKISLHEHTAVEPAAPRDAAAAPAKPVPSDTLVEVPSFGKTFSALTFPDYSALAGYKAWKWVVMFALIGTLESMLTAKAADLIDPYRRKTNLDRDNLAVGIANTCCALIGAAPMISEIVRTKANIDNGARTRFGNVWHGAFLLAFVTLLPFIIGMVPIAALTAMLIYTGYRLAHPHEFKHMYEIGPEQLLIYATTIVAVMATDLLQGIGIGIIVEFIILAINGVPLRSFFKPLLSVQELDGDTYQIEARHAAIFSNWIPMKRRIDRIRRDRKNLVIDLSDTRLVDHTVMTKLDEVQREFREDGLLVEIIGLDDHQRVSYHPFAVQRKGYQSTSRSGPTRTAASGNDAEQFGEPMHAAH